MKRMTARRRWDRGGVSEIVSTILILGLTVLLFSSIIAFVGRMPPPTKSTSASFVGRIEPLSLATPWDNGAEIFITHQGGRSLRALDALVILTIDGNSSSFDVVDGGAVYFDGGEYWDPADVWKVSLTAAQVPHGGESAIDASVIDMERNTFVWSTKLMGGAQSYGPLIMDAWADGDITTERREAVQNNMPFTFSVQISDPNGDLDVSSPNADMSRLLGPGNSSVALPEASPGIFMVSLTMSEYVTHAGYYPITVRASDMAGHYSSRVVLVTLGKEIGDFPEIHLSADNVVVSPVNPKNGDDVTVIVTVSNNGGGDARILLRVEDTAGTWNSTESTYLGMSDQVTERFYWRDAGPGGNHVLFISAVVITPIPDYNTTDNYLNHSLTIQPTILLVDDDQNSGSELDSTKYVREALDSGGFEYDFFTVPGGSGPAYNTGVTQLVKYDIVIWNSGYEKVTTLTDDDMYNLDRYLTETAGRRYTGSLWMLGQGFLSDSDVETWAQTRLHFSASGVSATLSHPLVGNAAHPVAANWSAPASFINTTLRAEGEGSSYILSPGAGALSMFDRSGGGSDAVSHETDSIDSRIVAFGFDFSRIDDLSVQTDVAYAVVLWLGNLTEKNVVDFAVTGQTIMPKTVYFKEPVTITAWIRNNGKAADNVSADMMLDGAPLTGSYRHSILVPGGGGKVVQQWTWNATLTGVHTLIVRVDPDGAKDESNERNNQVGGLVTTTTINVLFRLLVVDDDNSFNNGGALPNETADVKLALDGFGCVYENATIGIADSFPLSRDMENYSAVVWVVGDAENGLTDMDVDRLSDYMTNWTGMVWLQGRNSAKQTDAGFLSEYFGVGSVVSSAPLPDGICGVTGDDLGHGIQYGAVAGVCDAVVPNANGTGYLVHDGALGTYIGVRAEVDTPSVKYATALNTFALSSLADGGWQLPDASEARSELAFLILDWFGRPEERAELKIACVDIYLSDLHPQIGNSYVIQATVHNLAGYSEVSALVRFMDENTTIGSDSVGVAPDGESTAEIIWRPLATGSRTLRVLIDPMNETREVFEWFNNNASHATYVYFFFDDMESGDSKWTHESTLMNINSEGPLDFLPVTYTSVKTDVAKDWDYSTNPTTGRPFTDGVDNSSRYYHSYNESYFMEEPQGYFGEADVLISFALDDSKSMQDRYIDEDDSVDSDGDGDPANDEDVSWLTQAKDAAKTLLEELSDDSIVVSIWDFNGNMERRWYGPNDHPMTSTRYKTNFIEPVVRLGDTYPGGIDGRQYIRNVIDGMANPPGQTILWDAIGGAYEDVDYYRALYPDLTPVVIVLSDGMDLQASDESALAVVNADNKIECGSAFWCPWHDIDLGERHYDVHYGKYTLDWENPGLNTYWFEALAQGSVDRDRYGLLYADLKIFTIGLGLEHHDILGTPDVVEVWDPTITTWPGNKVLDFTNAFCNDTTIPTVDAGTLEYNLWRLANTTNASYFFAPTADDLDAIFQELGRIIATGGFNQTRSSDSQPLSVDPSPGSRAAPSTGTRAVNEDKQAVSPAFDLSGYETAKLSFWHKYDLLPGGNGGVIGVEVLDTSVVPNEWKFLYIIPSGVYTGGLYYEETELDDFGNRVQWCFNGVSGGGTFAWDHVELDILPYIPAQYRGNVRVAFHYIQYGGGTGAGWYLDDVQLRVGRGDTAVLPSHRDVWGLTNMTALNQSAHGGDHAWWNHNVAANGLNPGIDNTLTTIPIDLTNAVQVTLGAYIKFNINTADGIPPDCLRVEVTSDGGATWSAINLGVRGAWGLSGSGADMDDGKLDGKTYTGIDPAGDGWVEAGTMSRLNVDLSSWRGKQVQIRFRIVTNNDAAYLHYASNGEPWGVYIDDVTLTGLTKYS
jgi:hypothetical protein